jgi:hypothetical protein
MLERSMIGARTRLARVTIALLLAGLPLRIVAIDSAPPDPRAGAAPDEIVALMNELLEAIVAMSDYDRRVGPPAVFLLPQHAIEEKVCEEPCNVLAAYVPHDGIYLSANLDPAHDLYDRAALLHELVHHLQQGHPKFAAMPACLREREKEREAIALQNGYLSRMGGTRRVRFHDDFACEERATQAD